MKTKNKLFIRIIVNLIFSNILLYWNIFVGFLAITILWNRSVKTDYEMCEIMSTPWHLSK